MNFMDIVRHRGRCTNVPKYYPPYKNSPQMYNLQRTLCAQTAPTNYILGAQYTLTYTHMYKQYKNIYVLRSSRHLLYVKYEKIFWHTSSRTFQPRFILCCFAQAKIKILTWIGNLRCFHPPTTALADQIKS